MRRGRSQQDDDQELDDLVLPEDYEAAAEGEGWQFDYERYVLGFKSLLADVVKRAAHDWILYRNSKNPARKALADDAYEFLFEEEPGHPRWEARVNTPSICMAFLVICQTLDLDPVALRAGIKAMPGDSVMNLGRIATNRKRPGRSPAEEPHALLDSDTSCPLDVLKAISGSDDMEEKIVGSQVEYEIEYFGDQPW